MEFTQLSGALGVLVVAGPQARRLLGRVSGGFFGRGLPLAERTACCRQLAPVNAMRVNYVGELGWELHHPLEYQNHLFDALFGAGEDLGLQPFGIRAMDSMRFEKSYRMVGTEMSIEYSALESGMDRFVCLDKGAFTGRDALLALNAIKGCETAW